MLGLELELLVLTTGEFVSFGVASLTVGIVVVWFEGCDTNSRRQRE